MHGACTTASERRRCPVWTGRAPSLELRRKVTNTMKVVGYRESRPITDAEALLDLDCRTLRPARATCGWRSRQSP